MEVADDLKKMVASSLANPVFREVVSSCNDDCQCQLFICMRFFQKWDVAYLVVTQQLNMVLTTHNQGGVWEWWLLGGSFFAHGQGCVMVRGELGWDTMLLKRAKWSSYLVERLCMVKTTCSRQLFFYITDPQACFYLHYTSLTSKMA